MKFTTLTIEGMHCDGCAQSIRSRVAEQPGVREADVSFAEGLARVLYDPAATSERDLIDVVQRLGFRVVQRTSS